MAPRPGQKIHTLRDPDQKGNDDKGDKGVELKTGDQNKKQDDSGNDNGERHRVVCFVEDTKIGDMAYAYVPGPMVKLG
jgi:hypothetical protein